jgi:hypothetical protein
MFNNAKHFHSIILLNRRKRFLLQVDRVGFIIVVHLEQIFSTYAVLTQIDVNF